MLGGCPFKSGVLTMIMGHEELLTWALTELAIFVLVGLMTYVFVRWAEPRGGRGGLP